VIVLLAVHAALVLHCAVEDWATHDEAANLAAGLAYHEDGAYGLYNVNPPLVKQLAAFPVWLADPDLSAIQFRDVPGFRPEWNIGDQFARTNAPRFHRLVVLGRLAGLGWSLAGALLIYRWASVLWGPSAALLSLTVWCFEPSVIAHAHVLSCDVPAAVAGLAAAYAFRAYLRTPSWRGAAWAGALLGVAQLCKFTLVVLYPVWVVLWVAFTLPALRRPCATCPPLTTKAAQLGCVFAISLCVVNSDYEWAGVGRPLRDFEFVSQAFAGPTPTGEPYPVGLGGNRVRDSWVGGVPVPLPEAYLRGIDLQRRDLEKPGRYNYLGGEWRQGGWWYYYLYAAAVKEPLGVWGLLGLALVWPWVDRSARCAWSELVLLAAPALAIVVLVSSQQGIQKHFRYVLLAFPFAIVFLGRTGTAFGLSRWAPKLAVGLLLAWAVVSYARVHPHALAYFNEAAGGPEAGDRHLLGSEVDWGQDLLRLRRWLDGHPEARPLHLAYIAHMDPRVAGIEFTLPPPGLTGEPPADLESAAQLGPHPGWYALSVRFVRGIDGNPPDGRGKYRRVRLHAYAYFQRFRPRARIGAATLIYQITLDEANAVRTEEGLPPLARGPE
jgi:hypothetical protein